MHPVFEVMVVSSDLESRRNLLRILNQLDSDPLCVPGIRHAVELLCEVPCGLIFCDRELPDGTYREFLLAIRSYKIKAHVVVVARLTDWADYLLAMKLGAFDVIAPPCRPTDVEWMLLQTDKHHRGAYIQSANAKSQAFGPASTAN